MYSYLYRTTCPAHTIRYKFSESQNLVLILKLAYIVKPVWKHRQLTIYEKLTVDFNSKCIGLYSKLTQKECDLAKTSLALFLLNRGAKIKLKNNMKKNCSIYHTNRHKSHNYLSLIYWNISMFTPFNNF